MANVNFNIDEADLLRLNEYAKNLERDLSFVLNNAVKMYIAETERFKAEVAAADKGPYYTTEEVLEHLEADRKHREASRRLASGQDRPEDT